MTRCAVALASALLLALSCLPGRAQEPTQCLSPDLLIEVFTKNGATVRPLDGEAKAKAAVIFAKVPPEDAPRNWTFILYITFAKADPAYLVVGMDTCAAGRALIPASAREMLERELFGEGA